MNESLFMARKRLGKTQGDLASAANLDRGAVVLMERYGWIPPKAVRETVAKTLKSTDAALFAVAIRAAIDIPARSR